jgi:hypothetical protein
VKDLCKKYQNKPKERHVATKPFKLSCTTNPAENCGLKKKSLGLKVIPSTYPHFCSRFQKCKIFSFSPICFEEATLKSKLKTSRSL